MPPSQVASLSLRSKAWLASTVFASLLLSAGCGIHQQVEKYYLIATNIQLPYWQAASAGFFEAAKQRKVQAAFVGPETYDPKAEQLEFERIAKTKPSGILISPANAELMRDDIDAAIAEGIPVVTLDADAPSSQRLLFIGTDNYLAGVMGAKVAVKELHGKGDVVILTMPAQANLEDRLRGYRDVFAAYPGIRIIRIIDIAGNPRLAFNAAEQMVSKAKNQVDAFLCLEAVAGKEVAAALDRHQVRGKTVVAMDTDSGTLDWIKKGVIVATIAQKPYTMSYVGLTILSHLYHYPPQPFGQDWRSNPLAPLPAFVDTGATLIDKNSVDAFQAAQKSTPGNHI